MSEERKREAVEFFHRIFRAKTRKEAILRTMKRYGISRRTVYNYVEQFPPRGVRKRA